MNHEDQGVVDLIKRIAWRVGIGLVAVIVLFGSFITVPAGSVGVPITMGEVGSDSMDPGFHFKFPFLTNVEVMLTRLQKHAATAPAASKDLQQVQAEVAVPFSLQAHAAPQVFQELGSVETLIATIIDPGVMESVKAVTAQYTAEELVTKRELVKVALEAQIKSYVQLALAAKKLPGAIAIGEVAITHFDFSKDFNDSIEQKVKAEQDAMRALNEKRKQITQAEANRDAHKAEADGLSYATEVTSKAEAAAIQRKADALRANPVLVQLNAVDKWDGKLPQYISGSAPLPFLNVGHVAQ